MSQTADQTTPDRPARRAIRRVPAIIAAAAAAVLLVVVLVAVGAFGGWFSGGSDRNIRITEGPVAISAAVPGDLGITVVDAVEDGACGHVFYGFAGDLSIEMHATGCDDLDTQPLNGRHGAYRSLDDVEEPLDVEQVETPIGPAQVFVQTYAECTNFCRDFDEPVAIVALDDPVDEAYPTLVVRSDRGALSRDRLTEILGALRSLKSDG